MQLMHIQRFRQATLGFLELAILQGLTKQILPRREAGSLFSIEFPIKANPCLWQWMDSSKRPSSYRQIPSSLRSLATRPLAAPAVRDRRPALLGLDSSLGWQRPTAIRQLAERRVAEQSGDVQARCRASSTIHKAWANRERASSIRAASRSSKAWRSSP